MNREEIRKQIQGSGLIPSIRVDSAEAAIFAAENVAAGGIPIVEIAATIPDSDRVIRELTRRFPTLIVGAEVLAGLDEARSTTGCRSHVSHGAWFRPGGHQILR